MDNDFNHPLFLPDSDYGDGPISFLGDFNIGVEEKNGKLLPITERKTNQQLFAKGNR